METAHAGTVLITMSQAFSEYSHFSVHFVLKTTCEGSIIITEERKA